MTSNRTEPVPVFGLIPSVPVPTVPVPNRFQFIPVHSPWPWTVHGHGQSMAMDSPWPWTVHGHGQSMAMDSPWPWTVHCNGLSMAGKRAERARSERSEPGHKVPFTIQAYGTVYYTGLRHRLLYKLRAPLTIQAYHTVDHTSLPHR